MATPPHRHQASLENAPGFSIKEQVFTSDAERSHAEALFTAVLQQFDEAAEIKELVVPFRRIEMVRQIHQCSQHPQSGDAYLRFFFSAVGIDMTSVVAAVIDTAALSPKIIAFTDYLVDSFFLPLKACAVATLQSTPVSLFIPIFEDVYPEAGTPISILPHVCLIRDKHRCVVTQTFDRQEARRRYKRNGQNATDDDGQVFGSTSTGFSTLKIAHILPHSLTNLSGSPEMVDARKKAQSILDMFDIDVHQLITDRPTNALTLTAECHGEFISFRMYFEATSTPETYRIASYSSHSLPGLSAIPQPLTRTLSQSPTIDSPHQRLLAVHAAVARVLHMSGAGRYCDDILRDADANGTPSHGALAMLHLNGWWDGGMC